MAEKRIRHEHHYAAVIAVAAVVTVVEVVAVAVAAVARCIGSRTLSVHLKSIKMLLQSLERLLSLHNWFLMVAGSLKGNQNEAANAGESSDMCRMNTLSDMFGTGYSSV